MKGAIATLPEPGNLLNYGFVLFFFLGDRGPQIIPWKAGPRVKTPGVNTYKAW